MYLKGLQRVLIEGRGKNNGRDLHVFDSRQHFKAVHFGHLYVEKEKVRRLLTNEPHGFHTAAAFTDDLYLRITLEKAPNRLARQRLVVNNQCLDLRLSAHCPKLNLIPDERGS